MSQSHNETVEISLFPIPGCVCFPLSTQPLHVFEPRYRSLVKDSIRLKRRIGICHTEKLLSAAKPAQTAAEILNSNQATYHPKDVFSAGFAEIIEVSPDGRLGVQVEMEQRYEWVDEIQTLPYRIVLCRPYLDQLETLSDLKSIRQQIIDQLKILFAENSQDEATSFSNLFAQNGFADLSDEDFSLKIFSIVRFEPDTAQTILQMKSVLARLNFLLDVLQGAKNS